MSELDEIHKLESNEENVPITIIQTPHGPVPISVDENWNNYSKSNRRYIKNIVGECVKMHSVDTKKFFIDEGYTASMILRLGIEKMERDIMKKEIKREGIEINPNPNGLATVKSD